MIHAKEPMTTKNGTGNSPEAFIRNDQFNFIKEQTAILVNGKAASSDAEVLNVLRQLAHEKVFDLFPSLTVEQKAVLDPLTTVKEPADADAYLEQLAPFVIPFKTVTDAGLEKLFPKAKKLKRPKMDAIDFKRLSYLGWIENSNLMYLAVERDGRLEGIHGSFTRSAKKGLCTICHRHSAVGMFTAKTKSSGQDNFVKRGNYICQDNEVCNSNINTLERLHDFVERLQK